MVYRGHVARGVIVLDGADSLPDGTLVTVRPVNSDIRGADGDSVYELAELAVPTGVADLAVNLDHYLYGQPKVGNA